MYACMYREREGGREEEREREGGRKRERGREGESSRSKFGDMRSDLGADAFGDETLAGHIRITLTLASHLHAYTIVTSSLLP
jgi:hypothetical protein